MNPLGMMGQMMQIRQAQQQWLANQAQGQIWATSKSPEEAMQRMQQSPYMPYMAESMLQESNAMQAVAGATRTNFGNSMDALRATLYGNIGAGPEQLNAAWESAKKGLGPGNAQTNALGDEMMQNLTSGLNSDPTQAKQELAMRMRAVNIGLGQPADSFFQGLTAQPAPAFREVTGPQGQPVSGIFGGGQFGGTLPGVGGQAEPIQQPRTNLPGGGYVDVGGMERDSNGNVIPHPYNVTTPPGAGLQEFGPGGSIFAVGPTIGQQKYAQGMGQVMTDYTKNLNEKVQGGQGLMMSVGEIRDLMTQFQAGGGASVREQLAKYAQMLGGNQQLVDRINGGDLGAKEAFTKLMVNNVMQLIQNVMPSGSRLTEMEWAAFHKANPTIDTDPRAINKVLDFWTQQFVKDRSEQLYFQKYMDQGHDVTQWPATWTMLQGKKGLLNVNKFVPNGPYKGRSVSSANIAHLLMNDNPQSRSQFDSYYQSPGLADSYINPEE